MSSSSLGIDLTDEAPEDEGYDLEELVTSSFFGYFTEKTIISSLPNYAVIGGGVGILLLLVIIIAAVSNRKKTPLPMPLPQMLPGYY